MKVFRISSFTLLSGVGWCIDFLLFNCLVSIGHSYLTSNLISASVAVTFVFLTSRKWVFRNHVGSLKVATFQYIIWNVFAITVASQFLGGIASVLESIDLRHVSQLIVWMTGEHLAERSLVSNLAKVLVTPFTMYANFVAIGYIIERRLSFL
jgi:putative flippase GtrA